jgi:hypothetical protein
MKEVNDSEVKMDGAKCKIIAMNDAPNIAGTVWSSFIVIACNINPNAKDGLIP